MRLIPAAFELWKQLQSENRRKIEAVSGIDPASETCGGMLASSPAKTLKLAMIFEVCRWLNDKTRDWQVIQADTLGLAARHEAYCVSANKGLDAIAARATIIPIAPVSPSGEANIDAINCEADRIRQERHQHCEPDLEYVQAQLPEDDGESLPAPAVHHEVIQAHSAALVSGKWKVRFPFAISEPEKQPEAPSQALLQLKTNVKEARHVKELQEPDRKSVSQFPEWALRDKRV